MRTSSLHSSIQFVTYFKAILNFCLFGAIWFLCPLGGLSLLIGNDRPPNIVLIVADDLGYRELGCFGQQKIQTPHLDRLAQQGMKLTQHYSGSPVCAPSRCVLMTGKHPGHAYIRNNRSTPPEGQEPLPDHETTLAELLRRKGYATGAFGKWGLGGPDSTGDPINQGFDRFFGYKCQSHAHSYYPDYLWDNDRRVALANDPPIPGHAGLDGLDPTDPKSYDRFKGQEYAPERIHEQAMEFVRTNHERPFLLYYPTILTHLALHVPDKELQPYLKLGWHDPPFTRQDSGYTPHFTPRAAYAAMVSLLDGYVGRILDLLDELQLSENTIVLFTSDNGTTHLREEVDFEFFKSVGELRGLKGSLYEGGVRVPTIVRWPGRIQAGAVSDYVSGFEDWLPTLLEIADGLHLLSNEWDGVSLVPTLRGHFQQPRPFLYREFSGYGGQQSIRQADWKAIRREMNRGNLQVELYNLAKDVSESTDLSSQYPELVAQMTDLMTECHEPSELFPLFPALRKQD